MKIEKSDKKENIAYFRLAKLVISALIVMHLSSILTNAAQAMAHIVHSDYEYDGGKSSPALQSAKK